MKPRASTVLVRGFDRAPAYVHAGGRRMERSTVSRTNMSSYKLGVGVMLACQFALLGAPSPAHALTTTVEPIPTDVVGPPKSSQYPQPICNICTVKAESETNSSNQTRGLLFIAYEDEVYEDFEGSIKLTVLLSNDTQYVETIDDVELSEDEEMTWVLPNPPQLSWLDVEHVSVELVPAA
jgi:hypothetical protein